MKQVAAICALFLLAGIAFAGGIENKSNMSPGYLRNPSRNTETKRPEASFYNIAGTAFMEDGLYIEAGNQFVAKEYINTLEKDATLSAVGLSGTTYKDNTFVWLYPNVDVVYKHDNWAVFGNFGVYAGGGSLSYPDGTSATTLLFAKSGLASLTAGNKPAADALFAAGKDHEFSVSSITYGGQLGGAYAIMDMVSIGAALRFTYGTQEMSIKSSYLTGLGNGGNEISYAADAFAFSGVFGVHVKPLQRLDVSMQFQMASNLEYELKDVEGNLASTFGIKDGNKFRTDISPVLNFGVGYQVIDALYVSASLNWYLNRFAEMNSILGETDYDDSFEIAVGADYDFNKFVTASLGVAYGNQGVSNDSNNVFNPVLDSFQVGAGVEVRPIENLSLTGGMTYVKYFPEDYAVSNEGKSYGIELEKNLFMFAIGATYRLPL